jgi:hypothetical protein
MTARPCPSGTPAHPQSPGLTSGQGMVMAVGYKPVAVSYEFKGSCLAGSIAIIRASCSRLDALRSMWLEPTVILRLDDGRHLDIAITNFEAGRATFEVVGDP